MSIPNRAAKVKGAIHLLYFCNTARTERKKLSAVADDVPGRRDQLFLGDFERSPRASDPLSAHSNVTYL
jgi:hypothetical protein